MHMVSGGKVKVKGHATVSAGPSNRVSGSGKAVIVTMYCRGVQRCATKCDMGVGVKIGKK